MEAIKKDTWPEQKELYYPSEPVVNLGEMSFDTLYPYGKPKEATKKRDDLDNEQTK
jgi:hypothetical protein